MITFAVFAVAGFFGYAAAGVVVDVKEQQVANAIREDVGLTLKPIKPFRNYVR